MKRQARYDLGMIVGGLGVVAAFSGYMAADSYNYGFADRYKNAYFTEASLRMLSQKRSSLLEQSITVSVQAVLDNRVDVSRIRNELAGIDATIAHAEDNLRTLLYTQTIKDVYQTYRKTRKKYDGILCFIGLASFGLAYTSKKLSELDRKKRKKTKSHNSQSNNATHN